MKTYIAITTENAALLGWTMIACGPDRATLLREAEQAVTPGTQAARDIYTETRLKNLRVVTLTEARRKYAVRDPETGERI